MLSSKLIVGALGLSVACGLLPYGLSASSGSSFEAGATAAPCEPPPPTTSARPKAPTGLRIIPGDNDASGPYADLDTFAEAVEAETASHAYYDMLSARADCMVAYHLRSDAQLDSLETFKSGISAEGEMRYPIVYDAAVDAMLVRINPQVGSTDGEHKRVPMAVADGSMLLTWDLRFDNGFRFVDDRYLPRHKTYQIGWRAANSGDNRWLVFKTDYKNATDAGRGVSELYLSTGDSQWHGPGTSASGQETLLPRLGRFFIQPNSWTRVWFFVEDIGKSASYVSVWVADETQGPVQLYNRLAVITPPGGLNKFWFEYDTSGEDALNTEMRSWNRNFVVLKNISAAAVTGLLQKP